MDNALCFQDIGDMPLDDFMNEDESEIMDVVENSVTIGSCYAVLNTEKERDDAYNFFWQNTVRYPTGMQKCYQSKISLNSVGELEPEVVEWSNYGISDHQVRWNIIKGIGILMLVVAVMDVFFYFPYMSYVLKMQEVKGMSQGVWYQGLVLGFLITACNQIIYAVALLIADNCGFKTKDEHTKFYVVAYTAAVSINTFIDLWGVSLLARGFVVDHHEFVDDDAGMSMKALASNYALQMSLYSQLWTYIFPGTLLAPYICEPLMLALLFRLRLWIVRSRKVSMALAEELLQCPPFDLSRYGDILVIAILCSCLLLFTYRDIWTIFACAALSLIWIYNLDRLRLLRFSSRSSFINQQMSDVAHLLMAIPCAVLGSCVVFRAYASTEGDDFMRMYYEATDKTYHLASDPLRKTHTSVHNFLTRDTVIMAMITAALLHLLVHWAVLSWVVPYFARVDVNNNKEEPYSECAQRYPSNWFNTNPMFCLRSKYYYQHKVSCVQHKPGKEHILQVNHSIGQYYHSDSFYEAATQAKRDSYLEEFSVKVWDEIKRMKDRAVSIKRSNSGKHRYPDEDA